MTVSYLDTNKIVTLVVLSEHKGRVYVFRYEALPDNFDSVLLTLEKMINSFKILANTTQALSPHNVTIQRQKDFENRLRIV
jgi:hypothetical protein